MNLNDQLERWLTAPEDEHVEFKAAENQYDVNKALKYFVALANEGGGYLVLGVSDTLPRTVTGTHAFPPKELDTLKNRTVNELHIYIETGEIFHRNARVLVFKVPAHPTGQPLHFKGQYLMRAGGSLVAMTPDRLKTILMQDTEAWLQQLAVEYVEAEKVAVLLCTETYFKLLKLPHPDTSSEVLYRLEGEALIRRQGDKWGITNMAAMLLAKNLREFPPRIVRKAPRFILYEGKNKLVTRDEIQDDVGYAVGFEKLLNVVYQIAPQNRLIEETIRQEYKIFPLQALRELIANALIHQDFSISGASVMIEMYSDRVEISNPGKPIINVDRFIDSYQSRNEQFADIMRRFGICEEKGSGIDKVIDAVEIAQLPAPAFKSDETRTRVVLYALIKFSDMSRQDRIRACYQHCCLRYVFAKQMTNSSLRKRFGLDDSASNSSSVSQIIAAAKKAGLIKPQNIEAGSPRYARYIPSWD